MYSCEFVLMAGADARVGTVIGISEYVIVQVVRKLTSLLMSSARLDPFSMATRLKGD